MSDTYIKIRKVRSRYYGHEPTFEATIKRFRGFNQGGWDILGKSSRHASADEAIRAGLRLADRRGIKLENDPRDGKDATKNVRQAEHRAIYGDE